MGRAKEVRGRGPGQAPGGRGEKAGGSDGKNDHWPPGPKADLRGGGGRAAGVIGSVWSYLGVSLALRRELLEGQDFVYPVTTEFAQGGGGTLAAWRFMSRWINARICYWRLRTEPDYATVGSLGCTSHGGVSSLLSCGLGEPTIRRAPCCTRSGSYSILVKNQRDQL